MLGPLAVWTDDGAPVAVHDTKVRALLADLLLHAPRPVSADRLVEDLWEDRPPRNPTGTLQARVSQLRTALGDRSLVIRHPAGYAVAADRLDLRDFDALLARARDDRDDRAKAALLADALALWRGDALADLADFAFARTAAAALEERRLTALEDWAEVRLGLGEHAETAAELDDAVRRHPLRERLRALHLKALYRTGRQAEALAGYRAFRELLAEELGVDPGPELAALHQAILRHDPALAVPQARPASNLPAPATGLVGRERETRRVCSLLEAHRLVTLTGPGGVGKTRLALEAAGRARDGAWSAELQDGAWFVELAACRGAAEVAATVSAALDLPDDVPLARALRGRRMLLVLDNCEQVVEEVAGLVQELLAASPYLRILATSRQSLAVPAEALAEVPPLDPDAAAELFRARALAAGASLGAEDAEAVAAVCRRLDGLPLALELAATRVRTLGVRELVARLDDRFSALGVELRGVPARQRTLRAMIDWSWDLLTEPERVMLRRLAVHADGCTLEAAEAVSGPADVLARLVDKSLVVATQGPRYRLLESIAAYAAGRLAESGEEEAVRERHRRHYLELAERAEPLLRGPDQREWLARLDAESANLRLALDGAPPPVARRLVTALAWYWHLRGRLAEGRAHLAAAAGDDPTARAWLAGFAAALGEPGVEPEEGAHPRAAWFLGYVRWAYGDLAANERRILRALAAAEAIGDTWTVAAALAVRSRLALGRGDLETARRDGERGLALFRELGDAWGQVEAGEALGSLAETTGDYERAAELRAEGLHLAERLGLWPQVAFALARLGRTAMLTGDLDRAQDLHERAVRLAAAQSHRSALEFAEVGLGMVARRRGRLEEAERRLGAWLGWLGEVRGTAGTAFVLAELGFVAEQRGDAETALALQQQGYEAARATGDPRAVALALEGLAGARSLAGRASEAAALLAEAAALRESVGAPLPPGERADVDRIRQRIGRS